MSTNCLDIWHLIHKIQELQLQTRSHANFLQWISSALHAIGNMQIWQSLGSTFTLHYYITIYIVFATIQLLILLLWGEDNFTVKCCICLLARDWLFSTQMYISAHVQPTYVSIKLAMFACSCLLMTNVCAELLMFL